VNALERIVALTRVEVESRQEARPPGLLRAEAERVAGAIPRRGFREALVLSPGIAVIAEHKRRSPSAGAIREDLTLEQVVQAYERAGAGALSILTEGPNFGGSLDDLSAARAASTLPLLRKDFVVDRYQLYEALVAGADAVLLIVAALTPAELAALHQEALEFGLAVLVEVHDERELEVAVRADAALIGINNRDLATLQVDTRRTFELLGEMPPEVVTVAESGFSTRAELDELQAAGVDAVLIGEALMRAPDVEQACRALTAI
jgi:indole-3-glycerol phosphate synthase